MARRVRLLASSHPERPAFDTALARAILERTAAGVIGETMRLYRRGPIVAFARQDANAAGYAEAVRVAREAGFEAVERMAGGRAAAYHEGTLAFSLASPDPEPPKRTFERFEEAAALLRDALRDLGVDARIGEIGGEYCPGAYSINARGKSKLAGLGQRMISGAAHVGGVIVVRDSARLRSVLEPVYAALSLDWRPETTGAIEDEVEGVTLDAVETAIIARARERYELVEAALDAKTLERAAALEDGHLSPRETAAR